LQQLKLISEKSERMERELTKERQKSMSAMEALDVSMTIYFKSRTN